MSHFYLTLPSNSSVDFYPDNTLTQFRTKLKEDITLQGDWEVGLSEIIYPKSWYNITRDQQVAITCTDCSEVTPPFASKPNRRTYTKIVFIAAGYYRSMQDIIVELNKVLGQAYAEPVEDWREGDTNYYVNQEARPMFTFNPATNKVSVLVHGKTAMWFSPNLRQILGLTDKKHEIMHNRRKRPKNIEAERTSDVECGRHALYVYCDLLECVPVGDTAAPLLRIVDIDGQHSTMVHRCYERPRYVPLQKKHFGSLEIHIRDSFGEKIPFESGTVVVTLHFRKTKGNYFLA